IAFLRRLGWLARRRRKEAELRAELQFHLEEEVQRLRDRGAGEAEALLAARRDLGSLAFVQEDTRAAWGWTRLEQLGQDVRFACRTMAANRLFSALVIVCLALGIGANTAIYSFIDAILVRSLPVADPESLVVVNWRATIASPRDFVMHGVSGTSWDSSS